MTLTLKSKDSFEKLSSEVDELKKSLNGTQKYFFMPVKELMEWEFKSYPQGRHSKMNRVPVMDIGKNKIKFTDVLIQGVDTVLYMTQCRQKSQFI